MSEIVPAVLGACSGLVVGRLTARYGWWPWPVVAVGLGFAATVLTGEWRFSWAYLLVDIPIVAVSSIGIFIATRRRWHSTNEPR
jgi:hypothetical protein